MIDATLVPALYSDKSPQRVAYDRFVFDFQSLFVFQSVSDVRCNTDHCFFFAVSTVPMVIDDVLVLRIKKIDA